MSRQDTQGKSLMDACIAVSIAYVSYIKEFNSLTIVAEKFLLKARHSTKLSTIDYEMQYPAGSDINIYVTSYFHTELYGITGYYDVPVPVVDRRSYDRRTVFIVINSVPGTVPYDTSRNLTGGIFNIGS